MHTNRTDALLQMEYLVTDLERRLTTAMGDGERRELSVLAVLHHRRATDLGDPEMAARAMAVAMACKPGVAKCHGDARNRSSRVAILVAGGMAPAED
jgi:hypothetical protein